MLVARAKVATISGNTNKKPPQPILQGLPGRGTHIKIQNASFHMQSNHLTSSFWKSLSFSLTSF